MSVKVNRKTKKLSKPVDDNVEHEGKKSTETSSVEPVKVSSNSVEDKEGPPKKKRKVYSLQNVSNLCPIMVLNEMEPGLVYTFSEAGLKTSMIHHATVLRNNQTFKAEDRIKKVAKKKVAEIVLRSILAPDEPSVPSNVSSSNDPKKADFSSDSSAVAEVNCFEKNDVGKTELPQPKMQIIKTQIEQCQSSPLYQLKRMKPGIKVETIKEEKSAKGSIYLQQFTAQVEWNGQTCEGIGSSKKKAQNAAAQAALNKFFSSETAKVTTETENTKANTESGDAIKTEV